MSDYIRSRQRKNREQQIKIIFGKCPEKCFEKGLELGAGDGYQSVLLSRYIKQLVSTDLNDKRLITTDKSGIISYKILDAEKVGESFPQKNFDIIFSSNLLEHLPDVHMSLKGMHWVLRDDGIIIHAMPGPGWRFFTSLFHLPVIILNVWRKRRGGSSNAIENNRNNNLKLESKKRSLLQRVFIPKAHGISSNSFLEFFTFGKRRWIRIFKESGFRMITIKRGPVSAGGGYHLGFQKLAPYLRKLGITTEYIYIASKDSCQTEKNHLFK